MANVVAPTEPAGPGMTWVVSCELAFVLAEESEIAVQVVAAASAGVVVSEHWAVLTDGRPPASMAEIRGPHEARLHAVRSRAGLLTVSYRSQLRSLESARDSPPFDEVTPVRIEAGRSEGPSSLDFERQLYLRPSRYCPSDHLTGFAVAEFGTGPGVAERVASITGWIRRRIGYVPGSSTVHDSAEDTLLTGMGTCRDFAHLGVALCRATGIPARFAAVYAPGLTPMDFHAVFECLQEGRWCVHDATGLAPRGALVRIATGRDAADTAFADITTGTATLEAIEVSATVGPSLPADDHVCTVELA